MDAARLNCLQRGRSGLARVGCAILSIGVALSVPAADQYPAKPVKLVLPFQAGGPADLFARLTAERLGAEWGRPVLVDYVLGATGSIGTSAVAKAAPDGYTLLFTPDIPLTMYPAVAERLPYAPRTDFKPVGTLGRSANALFVSPSLEVSSVAELVALAKAKPGNLTFSSAGMASPAHFAAELFKTTAAIDMTHIPYKGAAPAMTAVLGGEVSLFFGPITAGLAHVRSGKVRALAVTDSVASPLLPAVKPLVEQGFPGLVIVVRYTVLAPAQTADAVVLEIGRALQKVTGDSALRAKMEAAAITPDWQGPAQTAQTLEEERRRWREVATVARITSN